MPKRIPLRERLFSQLIITPAPSEWDRLGRPLVGPCLIWQGGTDRDGYAMTTVHARNRRVHRLMYELFVGPIENEIDHLCLVRRCASPAHLEDVTTRENLHRAEPWAYQVAKTHCKAGHEYNEANTYYVNNGRGRSCRICRANTVKEYRKIHPRGPRKRH